MKKIIDEVKKAGLNEYEARSYVYLLKSGPTKASDLADLTSIPRARIYDILESLMTKGMVVKNSSRPITYSALKPKEAFYNLVEHKKKHFHSHINEISEICSYIEDQIEYGNSRPAEEPDFFVISGRTNVYSKILAEAKDIDEIIFYGNEASIKRKKDFFLKQLKDKNIKAKFINTDDLRGVIFKDKGVLLFMDDQIEDEKYEKAIFIKSNSLARSFSELIKNKINY